MNRTLGFVLCLLAAGCATDQPEDGIDDAFPDAGKGDSAESTAHTNAILRLVNTASLERLDAAISSTAARNIIAHRKGADGALGTADDRTFATLAQLDAVPYVGPVTLEQLRDEAVAFFVPAWGKLVEGVDLNVPVEVAQCRPASWDSSDNCGAPVAGFFSGRAQLVGPSRIELFGCAGTITEHTGAFVVACSSESCGARTCSRSSTEVRGTIGDDLIIESLATSSRSGNHIYGYQGTRRRLATPHISPL